MGYLLFVTLIQAFSFSLIGVYLAGHVDSYLAVLIRVVLAGSRAGATDAAPTAPAMPAFGWNLSDDNVADVLTYVRNTWGNAAPAVSAAQVNDVREALTPK